MHPFIHSIGAINPYTRSTLLSLLCAWIKMKIETIATNCFRILRFANVYFTRVFPLTSALLSFISAYKRGYSFKVNYTVYGFFYIELRSLSILERIDQKANASFRIKEVSCYNDNCYSNTCRWVLISLTRWSVFVQSWHFKKLCISFSRASNGETKMIVFPARLDPDPTS